MNQLKSAWSCLVLVVLLNSSVQADIFLGQGNRIRVVVYSGAKKITGFLWDQVGWVRSGRPDHPIWPTFFFRQTFFF